MKVKARPCRVLRHNPFPPAAQVLAHEGRRAEENRAEQSRSERGRAGAAPALLGTGGGARRNRNSAAAALRPGPGHGRRHRPGAAAARPGSAMLLLPAALRGAGAAAGLRAQLLPGLHPPLLRPPAPRRLPPLPVRLRAPAPAAQPRARRAAQPHPAAAQRNVGSTGCAGTLWSCCLQRPELGGAGTWGEGTARESRGLRLSTFESFTLPTPRNSCPRHLGTFRDDIPGRHPPRHPGTPARDILRQHPAAPSGHPESPSRGMPGQPGAPSHSIPRHINTLSR